MHSKRNKQKLPEDPLPGPQSQSMLPDDVEKSCMIQLEDVRKDVQCPICLGIIRKTRAVMECMHRFCRDCIEKSFRLGNNECPSCRTHCSSRRSLREDPNFDALIALLYPNIDEYEEEELALSDDEVESLQRMQKSYSKTFKRQRAALGKKHSASTYIKRSKIKYLRSSNLRRRQNFKNAIENPESSRNRGGTLSPNFEEKEVEVMSDTSEEEAEEQSNTCGEAQSPPHDVTNEVAIANRTGGIVSELLSINDIHSSSNALVWGRNGQRSNTRNTAKNVAAFRNKRLSRLIDHLRSSEQDDDELVIFIKLVSFEEKRVPNLPRPYLSCRPTLLVKKLCQYVAMETSLQTEEIELYLVIECQIDIVSGDGNLDPVNDKFQLLAREEETLSELKYNNNLNFGHLVIAYKRKMWNLNEMLSCVE